MTRQRRTLGVLLVFVVGSGLVATSAVGLAAPAQASPYPSWADVQAAKSNQSKAEAEIASLDKAVRSLQNRSDTANNSASGAGERYQVAVIAQQAAQAQLSALQAEQKAADKRATASRNQVGQLVAQLSHTGGGQLTVTMLTESSHASDLLYQLGTMANLTDRTTSLLQEARRDQNLVSSLTAQAKQAEGALATRTAAASDELKKANTLASTAAIAVAAQQKNESQLISQIAFLKGTTAGVEQQYYAGLASGTPSDVTTTVPASGGSGTPVSGGNSGGSGSGSGSGSGNGNSGGGNSGGGNSGGGNTGGGSTPSQPTTPSQPSTPTQPKPPTTPTKPPTTPPAPPTKPTPPPSSGTPAAVSTAIAYAKAQLGKPYVFGAAGPNAFDCSGLMMASYGAAGVGIGGHSVRWQWDYLGGQGRLVPRSSWKPGDILFYHDNLGNGYYHDAMYLGGGMMIEAPNPNAPVRIVAVRYYDLQSVVGRPVG